MYYYGVKQANAMSARLSGLAYPLFAAHVAVWIGTAVAYKEGKDSTDLWGWSCTSEAQDVLQPFFKDVVNFKLLCAIQVCPVTGLFNLLPP